jgi:hypothetical protein
MDLMFAENVLYTQSQQDAAICLLEGNVADVSHPMTCDIPLSFEAVIAHNSPLLITPGDYAGDPIAQVGFGTFGVAGVAGSLPLTFQPGETRLTGLLREGLEIEPGYAELNLENLVLTAPSIGYFGAETGETTIYFDGRTLPEDAVLDFSLSDIHYPVGVLESGTGDFHLFTTAFLFNNWTGNRPLMLGISASGNASGNQLSLTNIFYVSFSPIEVAARLVPEALRQYFYSLPEDVFRSHGARQAALNAVDNFSQIAANKIQVDGAKIDHIVENSETPRELFTAIAKSRFTIETLLVNFDQVVLNHVDGIAGGNAADDWLSDGASLPLRLSTYVLCAYAHNQYVPITRRGN